MPYLLDTTVLVDVDRGHAPTMAWIARQDAAELYLSAVTVGELVRGGCKKHRADPAARDRYLALLSERLSRAFPGRILSFDREAAEIWGRLIDEGAARGRRPPPDDAKIAATARRHGMIVATSNVDDFADFIAVVDPRTA